MGGEPGDEWGVWMSPECECGWGVWLLAGNVGVGRKRGCGRGVGFGVGGVNMGGECGCGLGNWMWVRSVGIVVVLMWVGFVCVGE